MKRLLPGLLFAAGMFLLTPGQACAQDATWVERRTERAAGRAEEIASRAEERAQQIAQRAEERARRIQERVERRLARQLDGRDGAHLVFGHDYRLDEASAVNETIVVVGGDATIDGHAAHDVVVIGGTLRLGPKAIVDGDASVIGGVLDRNPAAQVHGDVDIMHIELPDWSWGWTGAIVPTLGRDWWQAAALAFTIGRIMVVAFLAVLLVSFAPRRIAATTERLAEAPLVSTVTGVAAEMLFVPALAFLTVALIITIVGIPLLAVVPVLVAVFGLLWLAGYAAVAGMVGARLRGATRYGHVITAVDVLMGAVVLSALTVAGQVLMFSDTWLGPLAMLVRGAGWVVEYLAWTAGLGAALTSLLRRAHFDNRAAPPVVPPLPTPSATAI